MKSRAIAAAYVFVRNIYSDFFIYTYFPGYENIREKKISKKLPICLYTRWAKSRYTVYSV